MKAINLILVWAFILIQISVSAQVAPDKYVVFFTDKYNTPYSIDLPEAFLTQRALDRRASAGIVIDSTDLPVDPVYLDSVESTGADVLYQSNWFNFAVVIANEIDILTIEDFGFVRAVSKKKSNIKLAPVKDKFAVEMVRRKTAMATHTEVQKQLNVNSLHEMGFRGAGIRIAVIDAGFTGMDSYSEFSHLYDDNRLIASRNVASSSSIYSSHTHGTLVSSILCADLGTTYLGVANEAEYIIIRSETGATEYIEEEYAWVAAAEYADSLGADIINSSLGYTTFNWAEQSHTYDDLNGNTAIVSKAAGIAFSKGMLVVTSAGNSGNDDWYYVGVPADQPDIITVGSVNIDGEKSNFSSAGLPEHIYKPDVATCGEYAPYVYNGEVLNGNGTSFSSPLLAGAAACLWQANPTKTHEEVAQAIRTSASLYPNGNQQIGYGIPNFAKAHIILNDSSGLPSSTYRAEFISANVVNNNQLLLKIYSPVATMVNVKVFDITGNLMHTQKVELQELTVNSIKLSTRFSNSENQIVLINLDGDLFNETRKVSLF